MEVLAQTQSLGMNSKFSQYDLNERVFGALRAPKTRILIHFDLIIEVHAQAPQY